MEAVRLHEPGGVGALSLDRVETPRPGAGEALVRVVAAAITRDELDWPLDRLPAIPSYELSGVVAAVAPGAQSALLGREVCALLPFDRDGAAAEFAVAPAELLVERPASASHAESAALPLAGLSAWQGLFSHGRLKAKQRVLVQGASGSVGRIALQLAHHYGAQAIGTAGEASRERLRLLGAGEVIDPSGLEGGFEPVDLVFDTVGGEMLARAGTILRPGGRIVTVAEPPPEGLDATYFVVESNPGQLRELVRRVERGELELAIDSVFALHDARAAFERSMARGRSGKVVLSVGEPSGD